MLSYLAIDFLTYLCSTNGHYLSCQNPACSSQMLSAGWNSTSRGSVAPAFSYQSDSGFLSPTPNCPHPSRSGPVFISFTEEGLCIPLSVLYATVFIFQSHIIYPISALKILSMQAWLASIRPALKKYFFSFSCLQNVSNKSRYSMAICSLV